MFKIQSMGMGIRSKCKCNQFGWRYMWSWNRYVDVYWQRIWKKVLVKYNYKYFLKKYLNTLNKMHLTPCLLWMTCSKCVSCCGYHVNGMSAAVDIVFIGCQLLWILC